MASIILNPPQTEKCLLVPCKFRTGIGTGYEFDNELVASFDAHAVVSCLFKFGEDGSYGKGGVWSKDDVLGEATAGHGHGEVT